LLPEGVRAVHDHRDRRPRGRGGGHGVRGQPQVHLGRRLADQGRPGGPRLRRGRPRPADRPPRHQPGAPEDRAGRAAPDPGGRPRPRAARAAAGAWGGGPNREAAAARALAGGQVLTASALIAPLGWLVFVDLPLAEAFAPLYASIYRTAILVLFGIGLSVLAS